MPRFSSPLDLLAAAFAVALGILAWTQWSAASSFTEGALEVDASVVELRSAKRQLLEPWADVFARVEFETSDGARIQTELPTPVRSLGVDPATLTPGASIAILYDPDEPTSVRYGRSDGKRGALILLALAIGALFIPWVLRRSSLAAMAGGRRG